MSQAKNLAKLAQNITSQGVLNSAAVQGGGSGGGSSSPTVTSIVYPGNDTAVNTTGGDTVTLNGTNFNTGVNVIVNNIAASVVTRISSTQLTFTAPAQATGSYIIYVVNTDGTTGLAVPGLQYSPVPIWTTPAGTLGNTVKSVSFSTTLVSTGDGTITYSLASGALPAGITLNSSTGVLSGTTPDVSVSTTYNFTVRSTDAQNQDTDRAFSLTVIPSNPPPTIDFLVIAGGGPGGPGSSGGGSGGGGGAGGYRTSVGTSGGGAAAESPLSVQGATVYTITVGAGGTATGTPFVKSNGSDSSISGQGITTLTSLGGGFGGGSGAGGYGNGGSGGGGTYDPVTGGQGTAGQGYNGGNGNPNAGGYAAAGGGGAGSTGYVATGSGNSWNGGNGGVAIQSSITGTAIYYAAGGGGGVFEAAIGNPGISGTGGSGGDGVLGSSAFSNTGGGGGGSGYYGSGTNLGGSGGSGIIVIRYSNTYDAATTTGSPTYTNTGGYHIYKFTSSGSITF